MSNRVANQPEMGVFQTDADITEPSADVANGECLRVSCFTSVLYFMSVSHFTSGSQHFTCVLRCFTMFYECFMMP